MNKDWSQAIDELEMLAGNSARAQVGLMIAKAALARQESRGAHDRVDFPGANAAYAQPCLLKLRGKISFLSRNTRLNMQAGKLPDIMIEPSVRAALRGSWAGRGYYIVDSVPSKRNVACGIEGKASYAVCGSLIVRVLLFC